MKIVTGTPMTTASLPTPRVVMMVLLASTLLIDQIVKLWLQQVLQVGQSWPLLPGVFQITLVYNTGAAFSMLNQYPAFLLALTGLIFVSFFIYSLTRPRYNGWQVAAFGLLLGGALGNILDRLMYGKVVDYLDFVLIHYPVFNLADSFIFCGILLLVLQQLEVLPSAREK